MKTIRQIADELGVSKTAVRNKLTPEVRAKFAQTVSGVIRISPEGKAYIQQAFQQNAPQTGSAQVSANQCAEVCALVSILKEQIKVKDEQIASLTATLENNLAALNTAQALHAGTIQQLTDGSKGDKPPGFFARLFRTNRGDNDG
jgi:predicted transcriptional regulator